MNNKVLLLTFFLLILIPSAALAVLVKTPKGYRLTILPIKGGQELVEDQHVPVGKVTIGELKEVVYGKSKNEKNIQKTKPRSRKTKK
ncbi:hypothetical protein A946_03840 [Methylacidiphilum kamchatkense Kam1]|uniref:Uncharacterized protein n=1 Tax=Methylacidiphilum kamchatkense Kam1 TaxID=1202785 RepID=A0A0C1UTP9_9BACT|nr:hypothetical protein [Methylacidiphilum kamchatkense]KIE59148.1 hypothetical protein A946_03840 [Methylacidiphilum kamchatkense Kam1]QDQ42924.1 hypothetical protein kam1_1709 [Methylacidiphilum kamchatkense Kam1]